MAGDLSARQRPIHLPVVGLRPRLVRWPRVVFIECMDCRHAGLASESRTKHLVACQRQQQRNRTEAARLDACHDVRRFRLRKPPGNPVGRDEKPEVSRIAVPGSRLRFRCQGGGQCAVFVIESFAGHGGRRLHGGAGLQLLLQQAGGAGLAPAGGKLLHQRRDRRLVGMPVAREAEVGAGHRQLGVGQHVHRAENHLARIADEREEAAGQGVRLLLPAMLPGEDGQQKERARPLVRAQEGVIAELAGTGGLGLEFLGHKGRGLAEIASQVARFPGSRRHLGPAMHIVTGPRQDIAGRSGCPALAVRLPVDQFQHHTRRRQQGARCRRVFGQQPGITAQLDFVEAVAGESGHAENLRLEFDVGGLGGVGQPQSEKGAEPLAEVLRVGRGDGGRRGWRRLPVGRRGRQHRGGDHQSHNPLTAFHESSSRGGTCIHDGATMPESAGKGKGKLAGR